MHLPVWSRQGAERTEGGSRASLPLSNPATPARGAAHPRAVCGAVHVGAVRSELCKRNQTLVVGGGVAVRGRRAALHGEQLRSLLALVVLGVCGMLAYGLFAAPVDVYSIGLSAGH